MCRDRLDGTLRGCMLTKISHKTNYTQIEIGRTLFKTYYRGSPFIKIIISSLILGEIVRHPQTPIYIIGIIATHKAYLVGVSMTEYYPIYNKETPEHFRKMFAEYAESYVNTKGNQAKYNPETFVIEQEEIKLEENLSTVTERDLQNPHIKFFVERNPGWTKVHMYIPSPYTSTCFTNPMYIVQQTPTSTDPPGSAPVIMSDNTLCRLINFQYS